MVLPLLSSLLEGSEEEEAFSWAPAEAEAEAEAKLECELGALEVTKGTIVSDQSKAPKVK